MNHPEDCQYLLAASGSEKRSVIVSMETAAAALAACISSRSKHGDQLCLRFPVSSHVVDPVGQMKYPYCPVPLPHPPCPTWMVDLVSRERSVKR